MKLSEYGSPRKTRPAKADIAEGMEVITPQETKPVLAAGHRAEFAMRQSSRGTASAQPVILKDGENWHDAVRGDGGSYQPGGPDTMYPLDSETLAAFSRRADAAAVAYRE